MDLTTHGFKRIYGDQRTRMCHEDIFSIIAGKATVELGVVKGGRYLLFYSPPDGCTKIAIVSENGTCLITILEKYFALPTGVKEVTRKREQKARDLLRDFLFARIKKKSLQGNGTT